MQLFRIILLLFTILTINQLQAGQFILIGEDGKKLGPFSDDHDKTNTIESTKISIKKSDEEISDETKNKLLQELKSTIIDHFEVKGVTVREAVKKLHQLTINQNKRLKRVKLSAFETGTRMEPKGHFLASYHLHQMHKSFLKDCVQFDPAKDNYTGPSKAIIFRTNEKNEGVYHQAIISDMKIFKEQLAEFSDITDILYYKFQFKQPTLTLNATKKSVTEILDQICKQAKCNWRLHYYIWVDAAVLGVDDKTFDNLTNPFDYGE